MKTRFNTYDIVCSVTELQRLIGMRVSNIYDIDNKTYLIRLQRTEEKAVLLLESGNRIHTTGFEWPKSLVPSGFSMKLRKHLKNKRLEKLEQLGSDRIIELQFGSNEAAYHVILELYDRGNIILTDYEMTILNVLRPHTEGETVRFAVREKYPQDRARRKGLITHDELKSILEAAKVGDNLKKVLVPQLEYGPPLIEHVLLTNGFANATKVGKTFNTETDVEKLLTALQDAEDIMDAARKTPSKGYITQKKEARPTTDLTKTEQDFFYSNQEFHPLLFAQHREQPHQEFATFDVAVDEFFSTLEGQKIDMKALHQEREAMKKLENVRKDHDQRLVALEKTQETDKQKAELITRNQESVDNAILAVQAALAQQISWADIATVVKDAAAGGDRIAALIHQLKLETNHIALRLSDPYVSSSSDDDDDDEDDDDDDDNSQSSNSESIIPTMIIDIDLALTAFANARRYYDQKRSAAKKQQKTIESQGKALKSAEKKTKQTLKEVQAITNINKARKVYWFEKFFWFVSSENYLVIAGRDQQQNELIVKRYMKPNDVYVHADVHGASSVIIKNPSGLPVPPKTLNEAGTMAICYSVAWEAKVVTNAYWVLGEQVSKTAPTGEYLTTGSFMIRGKKHFLPPSHLILGFSFLFRLEEGSLERHKGERQVHTGVEEEVVVVVDDNDAELEIIDESDEDNADKPKDESDDDEDNKYPDTQIKIKHVQGNEVNVVVEVKNQSKENTTDYDSDQVVFLGDNKPVLVRNISQRSRGPSESKSMKSVKFTGENSTTEENAENKSKQQQQQQVKRGQKSKLKKIKEKYKNQDDEERQLRMEILQSAGTAKEPKKSGKKNKDGTKGPSAKPQGPKAAIKPQFVKPAAAVVEGAGGDVDEDVEDAGAPAEVDMLDALTGIPDIQDELLFAVPVVAPYNTLLNYKYKVKLTPGTGRRGKAARTAVSMFMRDRATTQREKDLLRSVKDELLARNLPGKVKLSAPKLQTLRK